MPPAASRQVLPFSFLPGHGVRIVSGAKMAGKVDVIRLGCPDIMIAGCDEERQASRSIAATAFAHCLALLRLLTTSPVCRSACMFRELRCSSTHEVIAVKVPG